MSQLLITSGTHFAEAEVSELPQRALGIRRGVLYVLEFTNGMVKVGKTQTPRARVATHVGVARRHAAGGLRRGWISEPHDRFDETEKLLITYGRDRSTRVEGREYLFGADFDDLTWYGTFAVETFGEARREITFKMRGGSPDMALGTGRSCRTVVLERAIRAYADQLLSNPDAIDGYVRILPDLALENVYAECDFNILEGPSCEPVADYILFWSENRRFTEASHVDWIRSGWHSMWSAAVHGDAAVELIRSLG